MDPDHELGTGFDPMAQRGNMSVLIVSRPGPLQDGLQALLRTIPQIGTVDRASNAASALRSIAEHRPSLVLLDASLPSDSASALVKEIKSDELWRRCLVLADDVDQRKHIADSGADVVLLKGVLAAKLYEIVKELMTADAPMVPAHSKGV
jgi:DNA-binding NarL/FixJ family response regulator